MHFLTVILRPIGLDVAGMMMSSSFIHSCVGVCFIVMFSV